MPSYDPFFELIPDADWTTLVKARKPKRGYGRVTLPTFTNLPTLLPRACGESFIAKLTLHILND